MAISASDLPTSADALRALLMAERTSMQSARQAAEERIAALEAERDRLRASHEHLRQELELFKRRLFIAKAERADNEQQLRLEFDAKLRELDNLAGTTGMAMEAPAPTDDVRARDGKRRGKRANNRGSGRRKLEELPLREERIEIADPHLEVLVTEGKVIRHGVETTYKLGHQRAGLVRLAIDRVRYKTVDADGNTDVITTAMPDEMLPGVMAAPSLVAHVIHENLRKGMPLFRLEDTYEREGVHLDRGTLSRLKHRAGAALSSLVQVMRLHALATAFCIATDATGIAIQPTPNADRSGRPCKRAHFLAMLADRDHVVFEYLERETGPAIHAVFSGFEGYVQADAKSVFNLLFATPEELGDKADAPEHDGCSRLEVGCWYHCRRRFWEAAVAKCPVAREGLVRIGRIFELDGSWKDKPPSQIKRLRERFLRPHVEQFFTWVDEQRELFEPQRGFTRSALGYAARQRDALTRFFDDGRLVLTNNGSERAIKQIALARKAWLFCGSDDHAASTAVLFSLIASARLHRLDPEDYLRCIIRLVPLWPQDRLLELAPLFWNQTRKRLDADALARDLGPIRIPDTPLEAAAQKSIPERS